MSEHKIQITAQVGRGRTWGRTATVCLLFRNPHHGGAKRLCAGGTGANAREALSLALDHLSAEIMVKR